MTQIMVTSDITVKSIDNMPTSVSGDMRVCQAAMVSTTGDFVDVAAEKVRGLIKTLITKRHGTPFEHNAMTFFVHAPIFVWREHHRHRIAFSYNEESGRYKQLQPLFWVPPKTRAMMPVSKPTVCGKCGHEADFSPTKAEDGSKMNGWVTCGECGHSTRYHTSMAPYFGEPDPEQYWWLIEDLTMGYQDAYNRYEKRLQQGYAKEIARIGLPVAIFSSCWVTCNARSLMHFLSLRIEDMTAKFPSHPQEEIQVVARVYEETLKAGWPITYEEFIKNGRVAP